MLFARIVAVQHRYAWAWGLVVCIVALWAVGTPALAQAPASCDPLLSTAEERYVQREFAEAEALVRACLAQAERADADAIASYRLLALIALRQDDLPSAERAVQQLLSVAPDYTSDPVQDPPAYVDLVTVVAERLPADPAPPADSLRAIPSAPQADIAEADPEIEIVRTDPDPPEDPIPTAERAPARERSGITRWLMIGGGVVAASVAAVLLASGGSSSPPSGGTPLPPPPPFPN